MKHGVAIFDFDAQDTNELSLKVREYWGVGLLEDIWQKLTGVVAGE